jgi:hypothetical protein
MYQKVMFAALTMFVLCTLSLVNAQDKKEDKPVSFNAEQIAKEYRSDPDAFDKKHKGKKVRVEGVVNDTILAKLGVITLRGYLDKKEAPTHIQAYLTKTEKASASKFKTNQKVTVEGTYPGAGAKFVLVLEDCKVVK